MSYPCTKCGACCRKIGVAVKAAKELAIKLPNWNIVSEFPYEINQDDSCSKLINNQCSVYEKRPLICRVDEMSEYFDLPQDEFYKMNIVACHELMFAEGIYETYKITYGTD